MILTDAGKKRAKNFARHFAGFFVPTAPSLRTDNYIFVGLGEYIPWQN